MADRSAVAASYDAVAREQSSRPPEAAPADDDEALSQRCRKFNNMVKRTLITRALDTWARGDYRQCVASAVAASAAAKARGAVMSPTVFRDEIVVVDLASGRGGDLRKWSQWNGPRMTEEDGLMAASENGLVISSTCKVGRLIGVDISPVSVDEARRRYKALVEDLSAKAASASGGGREERGGRHHGGRSGAASGSSSSHAAQRVLQAQYEVGDCFAAEFWASPVVGGLVGRVALVSIQFALHYGCDSLATLRGFLQGVSRLVKPGGLFAATIVDAEELEARVRRDPQTLPFTPLFDARPVSPLSDGDAVVGRIGFHYRFGLKGLVDCDEYAIPLATLLEEAAAAGFRPLSPDGAAASSASVGALGDLNINFRGFLESWKAQNVAIRAAAAARGAAAAASPHSSPNPEDDDELSPAELDLVTLYRTVLLRREP